MPPTAAELEQLAKMGRESIARMASTACKGDRENLHLCTSSVQLQCPKRDHNSCPRQILHFEARISHVVAGDMTPLRVLEGHGVPSLIARVLVHGDEQQTDAISQAELWWREKPRPLLFVLAGSPGTGKSFAAGWMIWRFGGRFVTAGEIQRRLKEPEFFSSLRLPSLLVIDDLGAERLDDWDQCLSAIQQVICERTDGGRFTVLPTNLEPAQLGERYGERVRDRIRTLGRVRTFEGDSLRRLA
jgi:hypothetical protein